MEEDDKNSTIKSEDPETNNSTKSEESEAEKEATSSMEKKIIRQIEHYFGDYNLCSILVSEKNNKKIVPDDKFTQEALKSDDGWVSIDTMLKFKRLAEITRDHEKILTAMKKSVTGLIEVVGSGEGNIKGRLRRSPSFPLPQTNPEEFKKEVEARTVYVEGFYKENTSEDDVADYFHDTFKNVVNVNMMTYFDKKTKERKFKGSVFVTFKDKKSAKKLIKADNVQYKDLDLTRKKQKDYYQDKLKEREKEKMEILETKALKAKENVSSEIEEVKEGEFTLPRGATLHLSGLGGDIMREDIGNILSQQFGVNTDKKGGDIAFILYNKGDETARVRFKSQDAAKPVAEKWNMKERVEIKSREILCQVLEGEEEERFLADSIKDFKDRRHKNRQKRKGGFQDGRGGKTGRA